MRPENLVLNDLFYAIWAKSLRKHLSRLVSYLVGGWLFAVLLLAVEFRETFDSCHGVGGSETAHSPGPCGGTKRYQLPLSIREELTEDIAIQTKQHKPFRAARGTEHHFKLIGIESFATKALQSVGTGKNSKR